MPRNSLVLSTIVFSVLVPVSLVPAQEMRVSKSDLPAAVQKTADEQSKGATVRGYKKETENGRLAYELQLTINGHSKDVGIDPKGNIIEIEEEVAFDKLPPAVPKLCRRKRWPAPFKKSNRFRNMTP